MRDLLGRPRDEGQRTSDGTEVVVEAALATGAPALTPKRPLCGAPPAAPLEEPRAATLSRPGSTSG
eukprot:9392150-Pyramimonas_sp.AAC.1